jgi:arylformamidase
VNLEAQSLSQRERAYSPSSCIGGNYRPFIDAYVQRSAAAHAAALAAGARHDRLAYGPAPSQGIELYRPAPGGPPTALLVFFHGGYWQELSAADARFAAARCTERGLAFAAVDYTLAPQATLESIVAECRTAIGHLSRQAADLGLDAGRVVVSGSSAGAHLAAMVSLSGALPPDVRPPAAAILVSGIYRLEPLVGTSINQALALDVARARACSPVLQRLAGFPPSLIAWGDNETGAFKAQSLHFAGALSLAGVPCRTVEVTGRNHFDVILDLVEPGTALGDATLRALSDRPAVTPTGT